MREPEAGGRSYRRLSYWEELDSFVTMFGGSWEKKVIFVELLKA